MNISSLSLEKRKARIDKAAEEHEQMFVGKFVENMLSSLSPDEEAEESLSSDPEESTGLLKGPFAQQIAKPMMANIFAEHLREQFGLKESIKKSMYKSEGIPYAAQHSISA